MLIFNNSDHRDFWGVSQIEYVNHIDETVNFIEVIKLNQLVIFFIPSDALQSSSSSFCWLCPTQ